MLRFPFDKTKIPVNVILIPSRPALEGKHQSDPNKFRECFNRNYQIPSAKTAETGRGRIFRPIRQVSAGGQLE